MSELDTRDMDPITIVEIGDRVLCEGVVYEIERDVVEGDDFYLWLRPVLRAALLAALDGYTLVPVATKEDINPEYNRGWRDGWNGYARSKHATPPGSGKPDYDDAQLALIDAIAALRAALEAER